MNRDACHSFLLIFTESLWYPPLLDLVTGDSQEVLRRTAVFTSRLSHYILRYTHPVHPQAFIHNRCGQTDELLQRWKSRERLKAAPPQRSPVFNNGLLWNPPTPSK